MDLQSHRGGHAAAAAAVVLKHHPEFYEDALQCRAMLYQMRVLFGTSETQQLVERLQQKANSFSFGSPLHYGGRHLFLKEEMEIARRMAGGVSKKCVREEIMAHSHERFSARDADAKLQHSISSSSSSSSSSCSSGSSW